jgi:hypothetical protein
MDNYHQGHIISLLDKVRIFETSLGEFGHTFVNAAGEYEIHLSNGTLFFLPQELEAQVSNTLTPEMLHAIAIRFKRTTHTRMHVSGSEPYLPAERTKRPAAKRLYVILGAACVIMGAGLAFFLSTTGDTEAVKQEPRLEIEDSMVPQKTDSFETKAAPKVKATEQ